MPALHELYREYKDRVEFFLVYIREAHATDAWQISSNERDGVIHATPQSIEERCDIAGTCAEELAIEFPVLVDGLDNATDEAYTGWPERLYLIGVDGRIESMGTPGPFGFEPADLGAALARLEPAASDP